MLLAVLLVPQGAVSRPCGPCCPSALVGFCRVGCPPPVAPPIFQPGPKVLREGAPHPQGVVILEAGIGSDGRAVSACVVRGLRDDADRAAQEAVLRWRFMPKLLKGRPVGVVYTVTVAFPPRPHWALPTLASQPLPPPKDSLIAYVQPDAACPAPRTGPVRVGSSHVDPPLLEYTMPTPPLDVHLEGLAIVEVVIDAAGRVSRATALRVERGLTEPVVAAVRHWRYARTCIGGRPVPVIKTVALRRAF